MGTKLVTIVVAFAVALFVASCGLNTDGMGDDDGALPDISPDETEPDLPEVAEDADEDTGPDEATPDETVEDVTEVAEDDADEDGESEDVGGDEADGDETDDGGIVDPCERPDIPALGVYVFFCFVDDITADMSLSLQIERGGLPIFPWAEILDCTATGTRSMFCELPLYYNGVYIFNVEIPGVGIGWSCGPGTDVLWGMPRVWVNHAEQTVRTIPNVDDGCNHQFTTPPSGPL
ncbi:MAG: hypothetical protein WC348_04130 [Patescibacteria group bacterium]|jgi:hypothetical protein